MSKEKMESLRQIINSIIISGHHTYEELLSKSQELDELILKSMKESSYARMVMGEGYSHEFSAVVDRLQLFDRMYQSIRIVDPVKKKVLDLIKSELLEMDIACYEFWQRNMVCENCISIRAYNKDDTCFKMEYAGSSVYMVIAVPISVNERKLVAELVMKLNGCLYPEAGKPGNEGRILSAIEHMNQAAVKDKLTGVYNRRYIDEKLPVDLLNSSLRCEPLSIIFAEPDFIKTIIASYGRSAGNKLLRQFAGELREHIINEEGWMARFHGGKFMICLPNTGIDTARTIAEKLREGIARKEFTAGNERIHLTGSLGVHTISNEKESQTVGNIIGLADDKLCQARNCGGNKVV